MRIRYIFQFPNVRRRCSGTTELMFWWVPNGTGHGARSRERASILIPKIIKLMPDARQYLYMRT